MKCKKCKFWVAWYNMGIASGEGYCCRNGKPECINYSMFEEKK